MPTRGQTIQIFCPSGEPRGVRIAEITTRIVQAVVVPRSKLEEGLKRPEMSGVGLYLLVGESEDSGRPRVYFGETEDCGVRLKAHHSGPAAKDFWNVAVAIVSRTGSFTKAHGRLLEFMAIERAAMAGRYDLDNRNAGIDPVIPEPMRADLLEVFETAEVLLEALGLPVFEPLVENAKEGQHVFFCSRDDVTAQAVYGGDGLVVLAGSSARRETLAALSAGMAAKRQALLDSGGLKLEGSDLVFTRDESFSSPSMAAAVVVGGNVNGWSQWKDAQGRTLDEVYRSET